MCQFCMNLKVLRLTGRRGRHRDATARVRRTLPLTPPLEPRLSVAVALTRPIAFPCSCFSCWMTPPSHWAVSLFLSPPQEEERNCSILSISLLLLLHQWIMQATFSPPPCCWAGITVKAVSPFSIHCCRYVILIMCNVLLYYEIIQWTYCIYSWLFT
jgi:hypothetical protein